MIGLFQDNRQFAKSAVTVDVLLDNNYCYSIISKPADTTRRLSWCLTPASSFERPPFEESELLYLLHSDNVVSEMRNHPKALGLLVLHVDEPFSIDAPPFGASLLKRLIVVRKTDISPTISSLQSSIQLFFFTLTRWTETLSNIVEQSGSIQDLVDASESIFENFIDINDATYNLIAFTKHTPAPDSLSSHLVQLGCHDIEAIQRAKATGALQEWREQKDVGLFGPDETVPFPYITTVMRQDDQYLGHVVMVCNHKPPTKGLIDLFKTFAKACERIAKHPNRQGNVLSPCCNFIRKIIKDPRCSQSYIDNQAALMGIDVTGNYQLALIDYHGGEFSEQPFYLTSKLMEQLIGIKSFAFMHEEDIVVLFCSDELRQDETQKQAEAIRTFCKEAQCTAYLSDAFANLRDTGKAYLQACLTRKYRYCIDIELRPLDDIDDRPLFRFEEAFCFYLYDTDRGKNDELYQFCINHTILDTIAKFSQMHSINDLKLLYYYLFYERKATPVGEQLNMHRNNVLYRIKCMEARYGFDLNRYETRQKLLNCYRIKILSSSAFRELLV
jgi:hypothetical protein